jgi:hypothetical protein
MCAMKVPDRHLTPLEALQRHSRTMKRKEKEYHHVHRVMTRRRKLDSLHVQKH